MTSSTLPLLASEPILDFTAPGRLSKRTTSPGVNVAANAFDLAAFADADVAGVFTRADLGGGTWRCQRCW